MSLECKVGHLMCYLDCQGVSYKIKNGAGHKFDRCCINLTNKDVLEIRPNNIVRKNSDEIKEKRNWSTEEDIIRYLDGLICERRIKSVRCPRENIA